MCNSSSTARGEDVGGSSSSSAFFKSSFSSSAKTAFPPVIEPGCEMSRVVLGALPRTLPPAEWADSMPAVWSGNRGNSTTGLPRSISFAQLAALILGWAALPSQVDPKGDAPVIGNVVSTQTRTEKTEKEVHSTLAEGEDISEKEEEAGDIILILIKSALDSYSGGLVGHLGAADLASLGRALGIISPAKRNEVESG